MLMRTKCGIWGWLLGLGLICQSVVADELVDRLLGNWSGKGNVRGMASEATLSFARPLGERFIKLEFRNSMYGETGAVFNFHGDAYYATADGPGGSALSGWWFDSRGYQMPVSASIENSALISKWGSADVEQGRTQYRLDGEELVVTDEVLIDGQYKVFGLIRYQRLQGGQ
jgi:hypothetical protein